MVSSIFYDTDSYIEAFNLLSASNPVVSYNLNITSEIKALLDQLQINNEIKEFFPYVGDDINFKNNIKTSLSKTSLSNEAIAIPISHFINNIVEEIFLASTTKKLWIFLSSNQFINKPYHWHTDAAFCYDAINNFKGRILDILGKKL